MSTNGQHEFDVVFEPQVEGYTVDVPDLPGCISEGDTLEEATAMIQEAMALYPRVPSRARLVPTQDRTPQTSVVSRF